MATKNIWLKPFDPNAQYVVKKIIKMGRRLAHPGHPIKMRELGERRMRQLYENRQIEMVQAEAPEEKTLYDMEHSGGGWWFVTCNGERIEGAMRREEADSRVKELRAGV